MNTYLYLGLMGLLVAINFSIGGGVWTAVLIIWAAALSQKDARMDCQKQLDKQTAALGEKYGVDISTL